MKRAGFILAVESYLVRKGLATIINRIPGASVVREFSGPSGLANYMDSHPSDFLVASLGVLEQAAGIPPDFDPALEHTLLIEEGPEDTGKGGGMQVIRLGDSKEAITDMFNRMLDQQRDRYQELPHSELTPREVTILKMISMGLTNKQMADRLFLSTHTVITHRKNISSKLGIKSVSGLTVYAIVNNILTIGEATTKGDG